MMGKIDINEVLFDDLKGYYEKAKNKANQEEFNSGLDYLESMVKFFAVLNIGIVKRIDEKLYDEIIYKNFSITPSLGQYKSLATTICTENYYNKLRDSGDTLYNNIYDLFIKKDMDFKLDKIKDLRENKIKDNKESIKSLFLLFDQYIVGFRNKFKGHGASFREDDQEQSKALLENLALVIKGVKSKLDVVLKNPELNFYIDNQISDNNNIAVSELFLEYSNYTYELSPFILHIECNKYSCEKNHRLKLFFYNDGKKEKIYYLDYRYNHFFYYSSKELSEKLDKLQKELIQTSSDEERNKDLLSNFIGREEELNQVLKHIKDGIETSQSTAIIIKGKPGVGKSAFISQVQSELNQSIEPLSYIFYCKNKNNEVNDIRRFYNSIERYLKDAKHNFNRMLKDELNEKDNLDDEKDISEKLQCLFRVCEKLENEKIVFFIDGLDELKEPEDFLSIIAFNKMPNNIHFVFTLRDYKDILNSLFNQLYDSEMKILSENYKKEKVSISLQNLQNHEIETLVNNVLPREIERDGKRYKEIHEYIRDKSEGLPLYIHYICENIISSDISIEELVEYTKKLPKSLETFYRETFEGLDRDSGISFSILKILFFSNKSISFDDLYYLIQKLYKKEDEFEFTQNKFKNQYFSKIEVFIDIDQNDKCKFYHLSIYDAIKSYYTNHGTNDIITIDYNTFFENKSISNYQKEQYKSVFDEYYYLKKDSDLYRLLEKIIDIVKNGDTKLEGFKKENFLNIYLKYIWFEIFSTTIKYEDIKNSNYNYFDNFKINKNIRVIIADYFMCYDKTDQLNLYEIEKSQELALLIKDYDRVLKCFDSFESNFYKAFISNLDKDNKVSFYDKNEEVIKHLVSDRYKAVVLQNYKLLNIDEKVLIKIATFFNNEQELSTAIKLILYKEPSKSLVILLKDNFDRLFSNLKDKLEISFKIASIIKDRALYDSILSNLTKDDYNKALQYLIDLNDFQYAYKFFEEKKANLIHNNFLYGKLLTLAKNAEYNELQNILSFIKDKDYKINIYVFLILTHDNLKFICDEIKQKLKISLKSHKQNREDLAIELCKRMNNRALIIRTYITIIKIAQSPKKAFNVFKTLTTKIDEYNNSASVEQQKKNNIQKDRAQYERIKRLDDIEEILKIINSIEDQQNKHKAILSMLNKINDSNQELKLLEQIENKSCLDSEFYYKFFSSRVQMLEREWLLKEIESKVKNENYKIKLLSLIAYEYKDLEKVLNRVVDNFKIENRDKILLKAIDKCDFEVSKKIYDIIEHNDQTQHHTLQKIAKKANDLDEAINVLENINKIPERDKGFLYLLENSNNEKNALTIAEYLEKEDNKIKAYAFIANKFDSEQCLEKSMCLVRKITSYKIKSKSYADIVERTDNLKIALEISKNIKTEESKNKAWFNISMLIEDKSKSYEYIKKISKDVSKDLSLLEFIKNKDHTDKEILVLLNEIVNIETQALAKIAIAIKNSNEKLIEEVFENLEYSKNFYNKVFKYLETQELDSKILNSLIINIRYDIYRYKLIEKYSDLHNLSNNLIYQISEYKQFSIFNTLPYILEKSSDSILEYYGLLEKKENKVDTLYLELKKLKGFRDEAEKSDDEEAYDKYDYEANTLRDKIIDEKLFEEFNSKYLSNEISEFKFKKNAILDLI